MITIKIKQEPNEHWPDGWSVITHTEKYYAEDHWRYLKSGKHTAVWIENNKEIKRLPEVAIPCVQ